MSLGFVAGGLLQGAGEGILAEAKTQRDFMLKAIDQEFQGEQQGRAFAQQTGERKGAEEFQQGQQERGFAQQTGEREKTEEFQAGESQKGRDLTQGEGEKNRNQQTAIQKQNQDFLATLPSNNPPETDPESGKIYTRTTNGLMPQNRPDGGQMAVPKLRVGASGKLYPAETTEDQAGEKLDAPQLKDDAIKIANERTSLEKTRLIVGGRQSVAETQAGAKKDAAQINADARMHIASASDDTKRLMIQTISDDKAKARDAQEKLKSMGIDAETANVAARGMSAAEVARINAGSRETAAKIGAESREPGAAQKIKGDQAAMEEITRQAQKQAKAQAEKMAPGIIARNMPGAEDPFKAFGGKDQFISDYADELANDQVAKKAGDIKMVRTPEQIVKDLQAARGGAPAGGGAPAAEKPAAPAKPAKAAAGAGKSRDNPATPQSKEDLDALESGDYYTNPSDGALYQKQ